jgi:hypothetical protein
MSPAHVKAVRRHLMNRLGLSTLDNWLDDSARVRLEELLPVLAIVAGKPEALAVFGLLAGVPVRVSPIPVTFRVRQSSLNRSANVVGSQVNLIGSGLKVTAGPLSPDQVERLRSQRWIKRRSLAPGPALLAFEEAFRPLRRPVRWVFEEIPTVAGWRMGVPGACELGSIVAACAPAKKRRSSHHG